MKPSVEPTKETVRSPQLQDNVTEPSSRGRNQSVGRVLRLLLLAFMVYALWSTIENRWGHDFALPTKYWDDSGYMFLMTKLAMDGDLGVVGHIETESLGAPFVGQLNDFPRTERILYWIGGKIAGVVGLFPASNIMTILAHVLAAFSFYLAGRLWRIPRDYVFVFSLVYAFLPHMQRSFEYIEFIFSGLLPLQLYVCWYIATVQKISLDSFRFRLSLFVGLISGFLGIYWIYLFLQLYAFSLLRRILTGRPNFWRALAPVALLCLVIMVISGSFIFYKMEQGENPSGVVRSYYDIEWQALKPIDLFLPGPAARIGGWIQSFLSRYYSSDRYNIGWGPTATYVGVCAAVGLVSLFLKGIRSQLVGRRPSLPFLTVVWIIAYSTFGGIHSLLSLLTDFYMLRGLSRYSAAIGTVGLLYFVFIYYHSSRKYFRVLGRISLLGILLFALLEQNYRAAWASRTDRSAPQAMRRLIASDRELASRLEHELPDYSTLFMLPSIDFPEPENVPSHEFYHHCRPFLYTSKLRYSFGSNKGRPQADWRHSIDALPYEEIAATLEGYGFSGILLNRRYYDDKGEGLIKGLGRPIKFQQGIEDEWVFIRLTPNEKPVLPTLAAYAEMSKKES